METLLYAMTFLPMALLVLTVHEAGHFVMGKFLGLKVTGFQIGIGPRIWGCYVGRTQYALPSGVERPEKDRIISVRISDAGEAATRYRVEEWVYLGPKNRPDDPIKGRRMGAEGPCITGRVKEVSDGHLVLRDTSVAMAWIPVMAMVYMAEDPSKTNKGFINTTSWTAQMLTIAAGVGANVLLLTIAIFALAVAPIAKPGQEVVTVQEVWDNYPASEAGIQPGDAIMRAGDYMWPNLLELKSAIEKAHAEAKTVKLRVQRNRNIIETELKPAPQDGLIGVRLERAVIAGEKGENLADRFWNLSNIYFTSLAAIVQAPEPGVQEERRFTGLISAAKYTASAVETAKLKAWIAIAGVLTLSMAAINLMPIPPLDGFQMVMYTIKRLRKGKEIDPKIEHALGMTGISILAGAAVYLALEDILEIIGGG